MGKIEKIKSLRSHPSDYSELLWGILVFFGGAINAVAIRNFVDWVVMPNMPINTVELVLLTGLFVSILFLTPVFFSLYFSKHHPEKRFVPPLYIHIVSSGLLLFFVYNQLPVVFISAYFLGAYTFFGGLFQNAIMIYFLGKSASSDKIIKHSLIANVELEKAKEIVTSNQFRNLFELKRKMRNEDKTLKLKTSKNRKWKYILEVKESSKKNQIFINFCFFNEGAYGLQHIEKTGDFYEYAISKIEHFERYFLRHYSIKVRSAPIENAESLVTFVLNGFQGKLSQMQEMTTRKRFSLIVVVISIGAGIGLIMVERLEAGIATIGIAVAIIADILLRR